MLFNKTKPLKIGTDCSGIEAPIVALQQLNIPFSHEFSSEIDKHCISTIKANFNPKIIFGDMKQRKLKDIPDIDLYVCGFPCQPFSIAGKRDGINDPRGTIFWECLRVIKYKKPIIFILENVKGLLSINQGETFKNMMEELKKIKIYNVDWKVLNTADYGIPQSRKRVFIVGIRKKYQKKIFEWPEPIPCRPLEEFVDWNDKNKIALPVYYKKYLKIINKNAIFINIGYRKDLHINADKVCPCFTTNLRHLYCLPLKRFMNKNEMLNLQGFSSNFKILLSRNQLCIKIGNSISVNVLIHLFKSIFQTI